MLEWIINKVYIIFITVIKHGKNNRDEQYGNTCIGVIIMLFDEIMIKFLQSSLTNKLSEIEGICIKLIDRWNRSDETRDRRHEQLTLKMIEDTANVQASIVSLMT